MKKAGQIILLIGGLLYALFGLLWLIAILVSFFRLDPSIYAQPLYGYLGLSLRIVRCLFYFSLGVLAVLLLPKKKHSVLRLYVFVLGTTSFVMEVTLSGLSSQKGDVSFLGQFVPLIFSVLYCLGALLYFLATKPVTLAPVVTEELSKEKTPPSEEKSPMADKAAPTEQEVETPTKSAPKEKWVLKTKAGKKE